MLQKKAQSMKSRIDELRIENKGYVEYLNGINIVRTEFRQSRTDMNLNELYQDLLIENKELKIQILEDKNLIEILGN